jgi:hypothetical protein
MRKLGTDEETVYQNERLGLYTASFNRLQVSFSLGFCSGMNLDQDKISYTETVPAIVVLITTINLAGNYDAVRAV